MKHTFETFSEGKSCGFCYPREQGTHGEIKKEWFSDWRQLIPVCRLHAPANIKPEAGLTFDGEASFTDDRK